MIIHGLLNNIQQPFFKDKTFFECIWFTSNYIKSRLNYKLLLITLKKINSLRLITVTFFTYSIPKIRYNFIHVFVKIKKILCAFNPVEVITFAQWLFLKKIYIQKYGAILFLYLSTILSKILSIWVLHFRTMDLASYHKPNTLVICLKV